MINSTYITCSWIYRDTPPNISRTLSFPAQFLGVFLTSSCRSHSNWSKNCTASPIPGADAFGKRRRCSTKAYSQSSLLYLSCQMESIEHVFNLNCLLRCLIFCLAIWGELECRMRLHELLWIGNPFVPVSFRVFCHLKGWDHDLIRPYWILRCFRCRHWKLTDGPAAHLDRVMPGDTVINAWWTGGCSLGLNKFWGCWLWLYLLKVEGFLTCLWLKSEMLCPLWDLPMHPSMLDSIFQKEYSNQLEISWVLVKESQMVSGVSPDVASSHVYKTYKKPPAQAETPVNLRQGRRES